MSDFDRKKSDLRAADDEKPENEGELTQDELNQVSGGRFNVRRNDKNAPNDKAIRRNDAASSDPFDATKQ